MKKAVEKKNISLHIVIMTILVFALFFSYCSSSIYKCLERVKQTTEESNHYQGATETLARSNKGGKMGLDINKQVLSASYMSMESSENIFLKIRLENPKHDLMKWFLILFSQFILLFLFEVFEYVKGWIIKISQTRYDLFMVHCMELKDGKKNAQSQCYSF